MKHIFRDAGDGVQQRVHRDAHAPETVYVETLTADAAVLEHNAKVRSAELFPQDSPNRLHDGDVVAFAFQFPTTMDYAMVKRREPALFARIEAGGDDGIRAAESLSILYPAYVITTKRGDARRGQR